MPSNMTFYDFVNVFDFDGTFGASERVVDGTFDSLRKQLFHFEVAARAVSNPGAVRFNLGFVGGWIVDVIQQGVDSVTNRYVCECYATFAVCD